MNAIPAGVEASLLEAGFTSTEVAILRRLLEHTALTLRELAVRTGKSTGVLDQASKKLLQKNIIKKEHINGHDRFTITSLDSILLWMEDDTRKKRDLMARRQQTFETFIKSYEQDKKRPEIEYFDGIDGLAKAYRKLLDCGKEIVGYVPVFCAIEDHPLRDFLVEWFRQRRKKGIFSRIITHDTPLGRRHHSRDIFEYRQSALITEDQLPFTFEKLICGDTVACFNYAEKRAVLFTFAELATMEKTMFESWWRQLQKKSLPDADAQVAAGDVTPAKALVSAMKLGPAAVPFSIKTFSGLREFFVSRKSIAAFCGIALLSAGITFYLYSYTKEMQFERMQDTVKSIAATGALQFDAKDLDALQVEKDWKKPEWKKVVKSLESIRKGNQDIVFVYIFRKNKIDPTKMDFVSDSHSLNPYANVDADPTNNVDADKDGVIDPEGPDKLQWPGQAYPEPPIEIFEAYNGPMVTTAMVSDSFGNVLSAFAPITDSSGRVAGIIGVDMKATLLSKRTADVFQPALYFVGLFLLFVLIRLTAFNRSLFAELWRGLQMRKVLITITLCAELAFVITFGLYQYMLQQTVNEVGTRLMSIVATAAPEFDTKDLDRLHWAEDMKTDEYQRVFTKLNNIKDANPEITYIYIQRSVKQPHLWEFVADSYSNYNLPTVGPDVNEDGVLDEADENLAPGVSYWDDNPEEMVEAWERPSFERQLYQTQWGTLISGYAPIKDSAGVTHGVLGADIDVSEVYKNLYGKFIPWLWFVGGFASLMVLRLLFQKLLSSSLRSSS